MAQIVTSLNGGDIPRALLAADHRRSISFTATFMLGRYFRAATSGVIDDDAGQDL